MAPRQDKNSNQPAKTGGRGKPVNVALPADTYRGLLALSKKLGAGRNPTVLSKKAIEDSIDRALEQGLLTPEDLIDPEYDPEDYSELLEQFETLQAFFRLLITEKRTDGLSRAEIARLLDVDPVRFEAFIQTVLSSTSYPPAPSEKPPTSHKKGSTKKR